MTAVLRIPVSFGRPSTTVAQICSLIEEHDGETPAFCAAVVEKIFDKCQARLIRRLTVQIVETQSLEEPLQAEMAKISSITDCVSSSATQRAHR